ncbi:phosphoglycerate mutase (2,3-diphosphoglycerate-independent) [Ranunculus cassubicifolius]
MATTFFSVPQSSTPSTSWTCSFHKTRKGVNNHILIELFGGECRRIAERLAKEQRPAAVYSSGLSRAKDTAEMIAKKWHIPEVIVVPELKERHVGSLQGLVWGEIQEKEPEAYHAFFSSQPDLEIPGDGESFDQLCERSVAALEEIASRLRGFTGGNILGILHQCFSKNSIQKHIFIWMLNVQLGFRHFDTARNINALAKTQYRNIYSYGYFGGKNLNE